MAENEMQEIKLGKNQEAIVRQKRSKIRPGGFSAISMISNQHSTVAEDLFDKLTQVSKGAFSLFNQIKYLRDEKTNMATFPTKDWPHYKRVVFGRQLMELRKIGLMRIAKREMVARDPQQPYHLPRQTYMINPSMIMCWDWEDAKILWDECKI